MSTTFDPDELAELEEERRFLLRSLTDLEREHAAGDVDDDDYAVLRDGYTARAAAVLRAIEDGRAALPAPRRRDWRRIVAGLVVVAALGAGVAWFVTRSSGQRLPGQELSGGVVDESVAGRLARARVALASGAQSEALRLYQDVLEERPEHPEALAYSGWLLALGSRDQPAEVAELALETSLAALDRAIAADPTYADPHCFLAIIAANITGDTAEARAQADECLAKDPPADMRGLVEQFVAGLGDDTAP